MARDKEKKRETARAYRERNRERLNAAARDRMTAYYKTEKYRAWLSQSRDRRKAYKAERRRKAGAKLRSEITEKAAQKAAQKAAAAEQRKADRAAFAAAFVGPPAPSRMLLGAARYQKWRYQASEQNRRKQIAKRHRYVVHVTTAYAREQLRCQKASHELVRLNQVKLLLKRHVKDFVEQMKEIQHGN